jgi:hypothetical protein
VKSRSGYLGSVFCAVLLALVIVSIPYLQPIHAAIQPTTIQPSANYFVFVTPTPDLLEEYRNARDLKKALQFNDVDLSCTPACWANLVPGKVSMADVLDWLDEKFPPKETSLPFSQSTIKRDPTAPNNTIGFSFAGVLSITAFSNDTQPQPKLRAFLLDVLVPSADPASSINDIIRAWLPENILKHNVPSKVIIGEYIRGSYYLLLDFKGWAVRYTGKEFQTDSDGSLEACPIRLSPSIQIWDYADQETDIYTLLQSLNNKNKYENLSGYTDIELPKRVKVNDP